MLTDEQIVIADSNMYSICMRDKEDHNGRMNIWRIAKAQDCSHENVRRRYNRHILHNKYNSLFSYLPFRLSMIFVNHLMKHRKRTEMVKTTTIADIFRKSDKDLLRIPGIGVGWLATIREAEYEYRK